MGKDKKSLQFSVLERQRIKEKFCGIIPTSILKYDKYDKAIDDQAKGTYLESSNFKDVNSDDYNRFKMSGQGGRRGALSRFPQNIGKILVNMFTERYDTIYDPFAGHNSRMQLCYQLERNYIGVDLCKKFHKSNLEIRKRILTFNNSCDIKLYNKSSDNMPEIKDNTADFTVTSPPYWNLEYYGEEKEQLGNAKSYDKFLELLSNHIKENYRILKNNSYCCYNVNDFKKKKIFYPYHIDVTYILKNIGFIIKDIIIIDLGDNPLGACFATQIEKNKFFPKRHEYIIITQKHIQGTINL